MCSQNSSRPFFTSSSTIKVRKNRFVILEIFFLKLTNKLDVFSLLSQDLEILQTVCCEQKDETARIYYPQDKIISKIDICENIGGCLKVIEHEALHSEDCSILKFAMCYWNKLSPVFLFHTLPESRSSKTVLERSCYHVENSRDPFYYQFSIYLFFVEKILIFSNFSFLETFLEESVKEFFNSCMISLKMT